MLKSFCLTTAPCLVLLALISGCSAPDQTPTTSTSSLSTDPAQGEQNSLSQDTQYKQNLESLIKSQLKTDNDITATMKYFDEQGGFDASKKRAIENCQSLAKGTSIEELTVSGSTTRAFKALNISGRAPTNEEIEKSLLLSKIYNAEVFAAQDNYCPETKKEFKIGN